MDEVDRILAALRGHESNNNYSSPPYAPSHPGSSASGAYQYLKRTWARFKNYANASDAPPAVQDEKARIDMSALLQRFNGDVRLAIASWYVGPGVAQQVGPDSSYTPPGNKVSVRAYVADVVRRMGGDAPTTTDTTAGTGTGSGGTAPVRAPLSKGLTTYIILATGLILLLVALSRTGITI